MKIIFRRMKSNLKHMKYYDIHQWNWRSRQLSWHYELCSCTMRPG